MEFTEAIKIALQSLWANKLRSILTLMGVMIGVAAVIMVITLVNGANKFVATKVYGYGADVFTASKQPSVIFSDAEFNKYQKRKDLKIDDYREVAAKCKALRQHRGHGQHHRQGGLQQPFQHRHQHSRLDLDHASHLQHEHRSRSWLRARR